MHRTFLCLALVFTASVTQAQVPRKKACDFLTPADISAVLGVAVGPPRDQNNGQACQYPAFSVSVQYSDAPDPEAVAKALKSIDANTYQTATPVPGVGDAALFVHLGTATKGSLTVYVGGTLTLTLTVGTVDQLRSLALKALGGTGQTGFAYSGTNVPTLAKPAAPTARSVSPLDQLKTDLTKKAEAGDARAALALADVYRYGNRGTDGVTKPDNAAAMYWYKNASDHNVSQGSYELATMYHDGAAGRVNDDAAKELLTKAANAGYVPAMMALANIYAASSDFVSKRRAAEWALKAAAANDPDGHLTAGFLWDKDQLSFNDAESGRNALAEYRKAADVGNCVAMMNIGRLYFDGRHRITQDGAQAQQWFGRAESCFGKKFDDMQAQAAHLRNLAAAGHLPVPPPPEVPITGSRLFKRHSPLQAPEISPGVRDIIAGVVVLTALAVAYADAHPELAANIPEGGSTPSAGVPYVSVLQDPVRIQQNFYRALGGGCTHFGEC